MQISLYVFHFIHDFIFQMFKNCPLNWINYRFSGILLCLTTNLGLDLKNRRIYFDFVFFYYQISYINLSTKQNMDTQSLSTTDMSFISPHFCHRPDTIAQSQEPSFHPSLHLSSTREQSNSGLPIRTFTPLWRRQSHWERAWRLLVSGWLVFNLWRGNYIIWKQPLLYLMVF